MSFETVKPSDKCRVGKVDFDVKYGIPKRTREYRQVMENLFRPPERKESHGVILAEPCRSIGIRVVESNMLSNRV